MSSNDIPVSASGSTSAPTARVFLPPSSSSTGSTLIPPLPADEELKPTAEELKQAFKSSILGRNGPDAPLLTRSMREKEEARLGLHSSRGRTWSVVRIRIRFSDRTLLEGDFTESDTIDNIYSFLQDSLDDKVKEKGVVIYTTPPKQEYRRDDQKVKGKTLRQLGLIPSAILCLKWNDPAMNSNTFPAPIKEELKASAQVLQPPQNLDHPPSSPRTEQAANQNPANQEKPLPKWLKGIVKK